MKREYSGTELWIARQAPALLAEEQARWLALLDEGERQRWERFRQERDRAGFLLGKVLTRSVLAARLGCRPEELVFSPDLHGKPRLKHPAAPMLLFNLSHTPGMAVLAVAEGREPGVDVESFRRKVDALALARRYFATPELAILDTLDGEALQEHFITLWTLKEAWLKAKGTGLREPLDAFWFDLGGKRPTVAFSSQLDEDPAAWQLRLYREDEWCIALALQGPPLPEEPRLLYWQGPWGVTASISAGWQYRGS